MRKTFGVLVAALSWLSTGVMGQTHPVAVHAAHLLEVKSGKTYDDQTIVIEAGKIVSVGATADRKVPAGAVRIDLPNATVLPGLIDAHTHLTLSEITGDAPRPPNVTLLAEAGGVCSCPLDSTNNLALSSTPIV